MGRPLNEAKRLELSRRAVDVLMKRGADLSMARLATALDVKRPTLLYYFPSRTAIAETALHDLLSRQAQFISARVDHDAHPLDRLYAHVCAVHAFHHGHEDRLVFLTQALATADRKQTHRILDFTNQAFEAHRETLVGQLNDAMADGSMHRCNARALMQLVRAVSDGLLVQRVLTDCDLAPIHELLWERVLKPLKKET